MGVLGIARAIGLVWGQRWEEKLAEDGILHSSHVEARLGCRTAPGEQQGFEDKQNPPGGVTSDECHGGG